MTKESLNSHQLEVQCDGTRFDLFMINSASVLPDPHTYDTLIKNETTVLLQKDSASFLSDTDDTSSFIMAVYIYHA